MNFVVENPPAKATGLNTSEPSPEFLELESFVNANPGTWVKVDRPKHSTVAHTLKSRLAKRNPSETMKYEATCRKAEGYKAGENGSQLYWIYIRRVTI